MRLQNRFTRNSDVEPRSTRRSFLRYLGVGTTGTALVAGGQKAARSIAHVSPTGISSGVNIVPVHGIWADGSSYSKIIPLLCAAGHTVFAAQLPLTGHLVARCSS